MKDILDAAGLAATTAVERDIDGESVIVIPVDGDGPRLWRQARATLSDHYPVLVLGNIDDALDRWIFEASDAERSPADLLALAASIDIDARVDEFIAQYAPADLGTGDEGYHLDGYDVAGYGPPTFVVIVPRPQPWAAFAYVNSLFVRGPQVVVAAAQRWYDRYGAEPTVLSLATGFAVSRPPVTRADAERLAMEHLYIAGLSARTTPRAYAKALLQLDHWCLYDRP